MACPEKTGPVLKRSLGAWELEIGMVRQRFKPEQIIAKLREVDVLVGRESTAVEARRPG